MDSGQEINRRKQKNRIRKARERGCRDRNESGLLVHVSDEFPFLFLFSIFFILFSISDFTLDSNSNFKLNSHRV